MSRPKHTPGSYGPHRVDHETATHGEIRGCADKVRYPDKASARAHREMAGRRRRPYRCDHCKGFHLATRRARLTPVDCDDWFRVGEGYATEDGWRVDPDDQAPPHDPRWVVRGRGYFRIEHEWAEAIHAANEARRFRAQRQR